jgi:hypothetical protein
MLEDPARIAITSQLSLCRRGLPLSVSGSRKKIGVKSDELTNIYVLTIRAE